MDFKLSDEQKMIQRTIRDFVEKELMPLENEVLKNERQGKPGLSRETLRTLQMKAKDIGFWGMNTPEEYGGANLGPINNALIEMELRRTFVPFEFGGYAHNILFMMNEEQKKKYLLPVVSGEKIACFGLSESSSASDASNMRTTAVKQGNEWVINGEKVWISFAEEADFTILFAVTDKEKGMNGITCFLVDREMGWKSEPIETAVASHPVSTVIFDNVRVPDENVIGEVGDGFKYAMQFLNHNRAYLIPAWSIGAAERLLSMAVDYSNTRYSFGKPLSERQAIQWKIAQSAVDIEAAKWIFLRAAWMAEEEGSWKTGNDSIQFRQLSAISKLYSTNMVNRVVDDVVQIHGAMGLSKEAPIERWYRTVRVYRIFEGSDEMQLRSIAKNILKGRVKVGELLK